MVTLQEWLKEPSDDEKAYYRNHEITGTTVEGQEATLTLQLGPPVNAQYQEVVPLDTTIEVRYSGCQKG